MKIIQWVVSGLAIVLLPAACSSGGSTAQSASCPGDYPVSCTDGTTAWCCPLEDSCSSDVGLCAQSCPSNLPVRCDQTASTAVCCPESTQCGPNGTCLPLSSDNGGSAGVGGGDPGATGGGGNAGKAGTAGSAGTSGNPGDTCTTSSECPSATPCCEAAIGGPSHCATVTDKQCRCEKGSECSSGSCAPAINAAGYPNGPYVCVPNDGQPYHGCNGALTSCGSGFCCFTDGKANQFCGSPCDQLDDCPGGAACNTYSTAHSSCTRPLGCGPK